MIAPLNVFDNEGYDAARMPVDGEVRRRVRTP